MPLKSHRDLEAWKLAMEVVKDVYRLTEHLPKRHLYGLSSQSERAALSIPANIAEGYGRIHRGDYVHHLSISAGSLAELETLVEVAVSLEVLEPAAARALWAKLQRLGKLLHGLIRSLKK